MEVNETVLKNNMYLPLSLYEACYLRGALRSFTRNLKQGDERDFLNQVLDRLNSMILDLNSYNNVPF